MHKILYFLLAFLTTCLESKLSSDFYNVWTDETHGISFQFIKNDDSFNFIIDNGSLLDVSNITLNENFNFFNFTWLFELNGTKGLNIFKHNQQYNFVYMFTLINSSVIKLIIKDQKNQNKNIYYLKAGLRTLPLSYYSSWGEQNLSPLFVKITESDFSDKNFNILFNFKDARFHLKNVYLYKILKHNNKEYWFKLTNEELVIHEKTHLNTYINDSLLVDSEKEDYENNLILPYDIKIYKLTVDGLEITITEYNMDNQKKKAISYVSRR